MATEFIAAHNWVPGDEMVLQYAHSRAAVEEIVARLGARYPEVTARAVQADFADMSSTEQFVADLQATGFIPTHVLVLGAAPLENMRFTELDWADFQLQLQVQLRGIVIALQSFIKKMARAKGGHIALVLSECVLGVPPKFLTAYVTAKYAIMGLGRALAAEYAGKIAVNMVAPAMMETKLIAGIYDGVVEKTAAANPYKRNCAPADVAALLEFLFTKNTFTTGAVIPVTGGTQF